MIRQFAAWAVTAIALLFVASSIHATPLAQVARTTSVERYADDSDSVFNWREVPAYQEVPLTRATFDEGGYQLYDTVGETVVVPFTNHDLYVMKFARSHNGTMYFVNTGTTPVLYVPQGGYLENATDPSARWYPFSPRFHPATPVYIGIAPSWHAFIGMGWYPDMEYYGGYWSDRPVIYAGIFIGMIGLAIFIGDDHCDGWWPYYHYCAYHRPPYRVAYWNRDVYRWAGRPAIGRPTFGHRVFDHPFGRPAAWERHSFSGRTIPPWHVRDFRGAIGKPAKRGPAHPGKPGGAKPGKHGAAHPSKPGGAKPGKHGAAHPGKPGGAKPGKHGAAHPGKPGGGKPGKHGAAHPGKPGGGKPGKHGAAHPGKPGGGKPGKHGAAHPVHRGASHPLHNSASHPVHNGGGHPVHRGEGHPRSHAGGGARHWGGGDVGGARHWGGGNHVGGGHVGGVRPSGGHAPAGRAPAGHGGGGDQKHHH
jgi:hypothetical protein